MKFIFFILAFFSSGILLSQKINAVDSIHGNKLPYALITNNETGFYTDEEGFFDISKVKTDTIFIKNLGYKGKKVVVANLKEKTVKMIPEKTILDEIIISNRAHSFIIHYNKTPKSFNSLPLTIGNEILINIFPNENLINSKIKSIKIKLEKNRFQQRMYKKTMATYRVNFYNYDLSILYSSLPNKVNVNSKGEIEIEIPNNSPILFEDSGIWIGLEFLDLSNNMDTNLKTIHPQLTARNSDDFTAKT
jgi:hypothetical protein